MIIKKIEIKKFGKFKDYSLNFKNGFQVLYGANEAGKSTIMDFIKIMFYSKRKKGTSTSTEDKALRAKYTPWYDNSAMSGTIEFEHKNSNFRFRKIINDSSVLKDETFIINESTGENIILGKRQEAGEYFFSLDLDSFTKGSFIEDIGSYGFEKIKFSDDSLINKLLNLSQTGDSELCVTKVVDRIDKAIKDLYSARSKNNKISYLNSKIENIENEILNIKNLDKSQMDILEKANEVENLIKEKNEFENKLKNLDNLKNIKNLEIIIEKIKQKNILENTYKSIDFLSDNLKDFENIKNEIDIYNIKNNELKENINNLEESFSHISSEEIKILENYISKKEDIKNNINELYRIKSLNSGDEFLKNSEILPDIIPFSKNIKNVENEIKHFEYNIGSINKEIQNNMQEISQTKRKILDNTKQLNFYKFLEIFISLVFGFLFILLPKDKNLNIMLFSLYIIQLVYIIYTFLDKNKNIKNLKNKNAFENTINNEKEKLYFKIDNLKENLETSKSKIYKTISDKIYSLENNLKYFDLKIKDFLKSKNANKVQDIYDMYSKSENLKQLKIKLVSDEEKLEKLKQKFLFEISKYKKEDSFENALVLLEFLKEKLEKMQSIEKEILSQLEILGFKNVSIDILENKLSYLKSLKNEKNYNFENKEYLQNRLDELKNLNLENTYIELKSKIKVPQTSLQDLESELLINQEEMKNLRNYLKSLEIAKDLVEKSYTEMRKNFSPKLNNEASKVFACLTGHKYEKIYISDDYKIIIDNKLVLKSFENFSSGTIDQAYLALRVAISKLISENKIPFILDDIFSRYDESRINNALEFFKNKEDSQTILFTCHDYIVNKAKEKDIPIIHI